MRLVSLDDDERRQQRRAEILQAAKEVFAERGFHNASINDIIQRAGCARGTYYLYFDSKQTVFDTILDEALAQLRGRITRIEVGAGAEPPQQQLRQNLVRVLDYVLGDRPLTLILLNHKQSPSAAVAQRIDSFFRGVSLLIKSSLDYGISMKLVRECNTSLVAAALLGAVRGVVEHCVEEIGARENDPGDDPDRDQTGAPDMARTETIVDEVIAFVLRGVFIG